LHWCAGIDGGTDGGIDDHQAALPPLTACASLIGALHANITLMFARSSLPRAAVICAYSAGRPDSFLQLRWSLTMNAVNFLNAMRANNAKPASKGLWSAMAAAVVVAGAASTTAQAADLNTINRLSQGELRLLSEDLAATLSFKPLIPAEALGTSGFDFGVAVTATQIQNGVILSKASNNDSVSTTLAVPSIRLHKGLPLNIDVGLVYSTVPDTPYKSFGGEVRWAVVPGNTVLPAVALRGAYTSASGVDQLKLSTTSLDVSVSKGFAMFTPYGGVGMVWVSAKPDAGPTLTDEKFNLTKVFAGVNINLGVNVALEVDSTGGAVSYGAKVGIRW
jgi:hypothetical protein